MTDAAGVAEPPERALHIPDAADRADLTTFLHRALRLDEAAVVRLRRRPDGVVGAWVGTGFDALAVRTMAGSVRPDDTTVAVDSLVQALADATSEPFDPGWALDSMWRTSLPPRSGFRHVDDVPAGVLVDLASRGVDVSRETSPTHGPPSSLLAQEVLDVTGNGERVGIPMRLVFALKAMDFVRSAPRPTAGERDPHALSDELDPATIAPDDLVRVRVSDTWIRLDARYGSVYLRRGPSLGLSVSH